MIEHKDGTTTITCDKCGFEESADSDSYNDAFYESGWSVSPRARKFIHKCRDCLSSKQRKAFDFVKKNFPTPK